jgi:uncharacterized protein with NRDE domain
MTSRILDPVESWSATSSARRLRHSHTPRASTPRSTPDFISSRATAGPSPISATDTPARLLDDGIFAISNAPAAVDWPKIVIAREAMARALEGDLVNDLMRFLTTHRGGPIEEEVFVSLPDRGYGTRSSTVVVMTEGEIVMREMSHPSGEVVSVSSREALWIATGQKQIR